MDDLGVQGLKDCDEHSTTGTNTIFSKDIIVGDVKPLFRSKKSFVEAADTNRPGN
jgi:cell shape-determining protein MreC